MHGLVAVTHEDMFAQKQTAIRNVLNPSALAKWAYSVWTMHARLVLMTDQALFSCFYSFPVLKIVAVSRTLSVHPQHTSNNLVSVASPELQRNGLVS